MKGCLIHEKKIINFDAVKNLEFLTRKPIFKKNYKKEVQDKY